MENQEECQDKNQIGSEASGGGGGGEIEKGSQLRIEVEFTGGLELLFSNKRKLDIQVPRTDEPGARPTMKDLINLLLAKYIRDPRTELFVQNGSIRPGILVLINDADWELEGEEQYELQDKDNILFVSTLHGG